MKVWISAAEAAKVLEISRDSVPKVAEAAGIRRQVMPGFQRDKARYHSEDVQRVAREAIIGSAPQESRVAS